MIYYCIIPGVWFLATGYWLLVIDSHGDWFCLLCYMLYYCRHSVMLFMYENAITQVTVVLTS